MKQYIPDRFNKGQEKYKLIGFPVEYIIEDKYYDKEGKKSGSAIRFYEFLFNPKYGWRETFDKDPDWQREFWAWMESAKVAVKLDSEERWYIFGGENYDIPTFPNKKLLTGYIKDFMEELI